MTSIAQHSLWGKTQSSTCRHCGLPIQDGPAVHSCVTRDTAGTATQATCRATFDGVSVGECDTVFAAWDALDDYLAALVATGALPGQLELDADREAVEALYAA
jgi:hypothetical protein